MGIALSLDGAAFSIYTAKGFHHRCISVCESVSRDNKNEPYLSSVESTVAMINIGREVLKAVKIFKVLHIGIKGYAHNAKWQVHQIGEVSGVIKSYLWVTRKMVPKIIPFSAAKKHVVGSAGRISQDDLRSVVEEGLGVRVSNNMEVDATIVARFLFDRTVVEEKEIEV